MNRLRPKRLSPGDAIGIIAPADSASYIYPQVWEIGVRKLRSKGFELAFGKNIRRMHGHTSGTIQERVDDLMEMFSNPKIDAIMCVWGGHNSNQLLEYIDYDVVRKNPKIFIGYSDITALNTAFLVKSGLVTFSGPQFITFCQPELPRYTENIFDAVLGGSDPVTVKPSTEWAEDFWWQKENLGPREWKPNPGWRVMKPGIAEGEAIGGNLGTLLLLAGTEYWPDFTETILFVEDDDSESTNTIDRYFTQLRHTGVFSKIRGLVIGRFPSKVGMTEIDSLEMIVRDATRGFDFPVISEVDFAHTDPVITIPIGVQCRMDTSRSEIVFNASCGTRA